MSNSNNEYIICNLNKIFIYLKINHINFNRFHFSLITNELRTFGGLRVSLITAED
jgi:hypothetical protein